MIPKNQTDLSDQGTFFSQWYLSHEPVLLSAMLISRIVTNYLCRVRRRFADKLGNFANWLLIFSKARRASCSRSPCGEVANDCYSPERRRFAQRSRLQIRNHRKRKDRQRFGDFHLSIP